MRIFFVFMVCMISNIFTNEIYKQIRIENIDKTDISLLQYSGIDIDHSTFSSGHFIEFAISEYELSILEELGYDYDIIYDNLQSFYESRLTETKTMRK